MDFVRSDRGDTRINRSFSQERTNRSFTPLEFSTFETQNEQSPSNSAGNYEFTEFDGPARFSPFDCDAVCLSATPTYATKSHLSPEKHDLSFDSYQGAPTAEMVQLEPSSTEISVYGSPENDASSSASPAPSVEEANPVPVSETLDDQLEDLSNFQVIKSRKVPTPLKSQQPFAYGVVSDSVSDEWQQSERQLCDLHPDHRTADVREPWKMWSGLLTIVAVVLGVGIAAAVAKKHLR